MHLSGSCYCGEVRFQCEAHAPVTYLRCHCSICLKTAGGGGFAINLGGKADSLTIEGEDAISVLHAVINGKESLAERRFCSKCGSVLWVSDPRWPELLHPFASAIDTPLQEPPEQVHMMLPAKPEWVPDESCYGEAQHKEYPTDSLNEWLCTRGLLEEQSALHRRHQVWRLSVTDRPMHDGGKDAQRCTHPPNHVIRARHVEQQAAQIDARKRTHLMA